MAATGVGTLLLTRASAGCSSNSTEEPAPDAEQGIDFLVDLNAADNENLKQKGGYVVVNKVIVAQTNSGEYVAVSSKCTYQGTELVYRAKENQFYCPLDLSRFDVTGKVISGPATLPLKRYVIEEAANSTLRVQS